MTVLISLLVVVACVYALSVITDGFFVESLDEIAHKLSLPPSVAGASLMAMGSSAPELAIALLALFKGSGEHSDLGIGTIVGSAVFNILVITGASALVRPAAVRFRVDRDGRVTPGATFQTLVDPAQPIPVTVQRLTGIDDAMVRGAPAIASVWDGLQAFLMDDGEGGAGTVWLAHHARSDLGFLVSASRRLALPEPSARRGASSPSSPARSTTSCSCSTYRRTSSATSPRCRRASRARPAPAASTSRPALARAA